MQIPNTDGSKYGAGYWHMFTYQGSFLFVKGANLQFICAFSIDRKWLTWKFGWTDLGTI